MLLNLLLLFGVFKGAGGSQIPGRPKIASNASPEEGKEGHQTLPTGPKKYRSQPKPSQAQHRKTHTITPRPRASIANSSKSQIPKPKTHPPYTLRDKDPTLGSHPADTTPHRSAAPESQARPSKPKYADNYALYSRHCDRKYITVSTLRLRRPNSKPRNHRPAGNDVSKTTAKHQVLIPKNAGGDRLPAPKPELPATKARDRNATACISRHRTRDNPG